MKKTIVSPENFFENVLKKAFKDCEIEAHKMVKHYLCDLLESYIETDSFFDLVDDKGNKKRETLAEMYFKAFSSEIPFCKKRSLLKKLGDTSLYVTGFFSDSFKRKTIDINYYIDMGRASYKQLADYSLENGYSLVFLDFSERFSEFVQILNYISQKLFLEESQDNLVHLYNVLLNGDSCFVQKQLVKKGFLSQAFVKKKAG